MVICVMEDCVHADMLFDKPINFEEALARRQVRDIIPTNCSSAELSQMSVHTRERSLALARVNNAEFLQYVARIADDVIFGRDTIEVGIRKLAFFADSLGDDDLSRRMTRARLNLLLRTQVEMAYGYGQWRQGQVQSVLEKYPAQEFYRAFDRKEPRDWPARWDDAGGRFCEGANSSYPQGRMIAAKNSPIWVAISAFGNPYAPFDFNSGMMLRDVPREEAIRLGVIQPNQVIHPQARDFERDSRATITILSPELEQVLVESLGDGWSIEGGVLHKGNECKIQQLRNERYFVNCLN